MEVVCHHAEKNKGRGGGMGGVKKEMEHSETALPTCNWIFYYYGDFSVAPSFAQNSRKRHERNKADREKVTKSPEEETVSKGQRY